jgi:hypothetical protein
MSRPFKLVKLTTVVLAATIFAMPLMAQDAFDPAERHAIQAFLAAAIPNSSRTFKSACAAQWVRVQTQDGHKVWFTGLWQISIDSEREDHDIYLLA